MHMHHITISLWDKGVYREDKLQWYKIYFEAMKFGLVHDIANE